MSANTVEYHRNRWKKNPELDFPVICRGRILRTLTATKQYVVGTIMGPVYFRAMIIELTDRGLLDGD